MACYWQSCFRFILMEVVCFSGFAVKGWLWPCAPNSWCVVFAGGLVALVSFWGLLFGLMVPPIHGVHAESILVKTDSMTRHSYGSPLWELSALETNWYTRNFERNKVTHIVEYGPVFPAVYISKATTSFLSKDIVMKCKVKCCNHFYFTRNWWVELIVVCIQMWFLKHVFWMIGMAQ